MFHRAKQRIAECETALADLRCAHDIAHLNEHFGTFVVKFRSVTFTLQKDGAPIAGFAEAYSEYQEEMARDELLSRLKDARNEYEKEGLGAFQVARFDDVVIQGPVNLPIAFNASFGACYVENAGTPDERLVPISRYGSGGGQIARPGTAVFRFDATTHLGQSIEHLQVHEKLSCALVYLKNMVHDLASRFGE